LTMGKHAVGTPKWISNKIKSKGLQKLRWYCQMCQKQCRDENGFKCHTTSEAHQRQLLLFGENSGKFLSSYSREFELGFTLILKRQFNEKRVHANVVYQQYIGDKEHVHMNSTCWVTLTSFVKHLGRTGQAVVDETEKGWYITWIDNSPETLARKKALEKKEKMAMDDNEKVQEYIDEQILKAKLASTDEGVSEATELERDEDEVIKLDIKMGDGLKTKIEHKPLLVNALKSSKEVEKSKGKEDEKKRKMSALEEIIEIEKMKKRRKDEMDSRQREMEEKKRREIEEANPFDDDDGDKKPDTKPWLRRNIVVKIVTKSLGDKYYKKKGYVKEVKDKFTAVVVLNDTGAKVKLDQDHLETVVPQAGRDVVILQGRHSGSLAILQKIDTDNFCANLKLVTGDYKGEKVSLPYEEFTKLYVP